ncbi:hypothetical protein GCM10010919_03760 [Alishewanella longhuensis]|uniref:Transposase n=1 Tax=Alishewanella longhuensis TaxID=1091037 RepID=A0ABQ3KY10_9ALTE|nr:hypothetical protein [Alishewanella longhuensis]GHG60356.1 hypothetical protein GCM10010919_03760 [Alishewanella longhuensis]
MANVKVRIFKTDKQKSRLNKRLFCEFGATTARVLNDPLLALIRERKPRTIIFVGKILIEAFNDIRIREDDESLLGQRSGNAKTHIGKPKNPRGRNFKVLT